MKKIVGLEKKLQKLSDTDTGDMLTFKDMFRNGVALFVTKVSSEASELYSLANKLKSAGDSIELDDVEFKLLQQRINENPGFSTNQPWPIWIHGQCVEKLEAASKQ